MNQNEIIRRITQLSNKSYIPYCSIAEEAKKLKSDGEILEIHNGRLEFSGPIIGSNITETNNMDIESKADKEHTHTDINDRLEGVNELKNDIIDYLKKLSANIEIYHPNKQKFYRPSIV